MEKTIIDSFDEACRIASELSDNLYYDTDFTPSAFRIFLDHLPTIIRVFVQVSIKDNEMCPGLCTIFFDPVRTSGRTSISITFRGTWLTDIYFRFHRNVPRTYLYTYEYDSDLTF